MIDRSQTDLSTAPMVLASRKSKLAMAQTEEVRRSILPVPAEILSLSTTGDEALDRPLADVGGKGAFVKTFQAREGAFEGLSGTLSKRSLSSSARIRCAS